MVLANERTEEQIVSPNIRFVQVSELPVKHTSGSKVYHLFGCRAAKRIQISEDIPRWRADGKGWRPCRNCKH